MMSSSPVLTDQMLARRGVLVGGLSATLLGLAGCGSSGGSGAGPATTTTTTGAVADGEAAAGGVAALAQAFYRTLGTDLRAKVLLDYSLADAERWSNLPQGLLTGGMGGGTGGLPGGPSGMPSGGGSGAPPSGKPTGGAGTGNAGTGNAGTGGAGTDGAGTGGAGTGGAGTGSGGQGRPGISVGDLGDAQLAAFTALLKAATGSGPGVGYDEIEQHLSADDYLADHGGGDTYGRKNFYVAILGSPQDSGTWEFQFGGHHLAVANTYTDGRLAGATPSFRGIEPNAAFALNSRTNQPMKVKERAFTALLAGLSPSQLADARLSDTFSDLVLAPGKDWAFPTDNEGLKVSSLSSAQKKLVLNAIASYVDDIADDDAKTILRTYTGELDDTYVAYSGTTALTDRNDYVRIDGPSVWIEFSMQNGIVLSGNHPHSVWRDRSTDYGGTQS